MNIEETEFGNGRVRMNNRIVPASRWNTRRTKMIGTSLVMLGGAAFLTGCADTGSLGSSGGGKPTTTTSVPATTTPVVTTPVESGSLALKTVTMHLAWTASERSDRSVDDCCRAGRRSEPTHASSALEIKGTGMKAKLSTSDLGVSGGAALVAQLKPVTEVKLDGVPVPVGADGNCGQYGEGRQDSRRGNTFHLRQGFRDSVVDGSVVELGAIRRESGADSRMMSVRTTRAL